MAVVAKHKTVLALSQQVQHDKFERPTTQSNDLGVTKLRKGVSATYSFLIGHFIPIGLAHVVQLQ